jgi:AraC family transcriptional regulator
MALQVTVMNKSRTTLDYSRRIERVVAHIGSHLDDALELETLAGIACFSPYHFHRIYRGLMRETVADTLRRLRLHRAAGDLTHSRRPMEAIATRAGYGSVAAFTRAFGAVYGTPPASFRRRYLERGIVPTVTAAPQPETEENAMYDVQFRETQPMRLAAISHHGAYMQIGTAFERIFAWAAGRGLLTPATRSIGVYYSDPHTVPAEDLVSDAGITVGPEVKAEGDVHILDIAGGRHAVITHKGPYAELERAYTWLYRTWLPESGLEAADRPCFEEYLNDPRSLPPTEWLTAIYLPLAAAEQAA